VSLPFGSSLEPSVADAERQRVAGRNGVPGGWRRLTWELHARLQWAQVKVSACLRQGSRGTNPPTPTNPRATLPSPHLGCLAWAGRWPGRSCHTCSAGCVQSRLEPQRQSQGDRGIQAVKALCLPYDPLGLREAGEPRQNEEKSANAVHMWPLIARGEGRLAPVIVWGSECDVSLRGVPLLSLRGNMGQGLASFFYTQKTAREIKICMWAG
jgi:hypothetical protein